jgi:hypothetical protein
MTEDEITSAMAPMSIHEDFIQKLRARDPETGEIESDDALAAMEQGMAAGRKAAEQIAAVVNALAADQSQTAGSAAIKARTVALQLGEKAANTFDQLVSETRREISALEDSMNPAIDAGALQIESEVRQRLAAMTNEDRAEAISKAISDGDELTIGAITRGPAWLSGLSKVEVEFRRGQWWQKRWPAEYARLERLKRAEECVDRAGKSMVAFVRRIADQPGAALAEAAAAKVAEAMAAVKASAEEAA